MSLPPVSDTRPHTSFVGSRGAVSARTPDVSDPALDTQIRAATARPASRPGSGARVRHLSTGLGKYSPPRNRNSPSRQNFMQSRARSCTPDNVPGIPAGSVVTRRYSFETGIVSSQPYTQHFDIYIGKENIIEHRTDYLRVYYTDFIEHSPPPLFEVPESKVVDAKWMLLATPRTRVEAYPMFVLLKDLLQQLMDETLVIIDSDLDRLRHEKADLIAEMEAMRDEMQGIINTRDATIESLQEQVAELTENLRDANKKIKAVAEEMRDLKKNNSELTLKLKQAEAEATRTAVANRQLTAIKNEHMKCQANINQLQARLQVATDGRSGQPGDIESMTAEAKATLMKKLLQDRPSVFAIVGVEFLVEQGLPDPLDVAVFKILLKKFIPDDCPDPLAALAKFMGAQPLKMLAKIVQGLLESGMDPETLFGSLDVTKDPNAMWKMAKGILGPMVADESGESLLGLMAGLLGEDSGSDLMKRLRVRAEVDAAFDIETQTETEEAEAEAVPEEPQEEEQVVETKPNRIVIETVGPRTGDKVWGPKGAQKPMTVPNMIKVIAQIYEEKTIADEVDDRENNTRQTMAEFVKDYFIRTYGLKSLATKNLHALAAGVRKSYKSSMRLQVFGLIAGIITLPSREGCYVEGSGDLICDALGSLFPKSSISERLSKENPVAPLEALQEAIVSALRMAKDGGGIRSAERIMELCMEGGDGEGLDVDQWMWIMVEEWVRYSFAGEPAIMKLFYEIDDNASGILSEAEFVEGVLRMEGVSEDRAVEAFAAYAVDRGGVSVLNEEAFAKLLRGCDDVCSAAGVQLPDIPEEGAEVETPSLFDYE